MPLTRPRFLPPPAPRGSRREAWGLLLGGLSVLLPTFGLAFGNGLGDMRVPLMAAGFAVAAAALVAAGRGFAVSAGGAGGRA